MARYFYLFLFLFFSLYSFDESTENVDSLPESKIEEALPDNFNALFTRMIITTSLIIILIIATLWAFKKFIRKKIFFSNSQNMVRILESRTLSAKSILYLIEVEKQKILISESHAGVSKIHCLNKTEQNESV